MTKEESNKIESTIQRFTTKLFDVIGELSEDGEVINNADIPLNALVRLLAIRIVYRGRSLSNDLELLGSVIEKLMTNVNDIRKKVEKSVRPQ